MNEKELEASVNDDIVGDDETKEVSDEAEHGESLETEQEESLEAMLARINRERDGIPAELTPVEEPVTEQLEARVDTKVMFKTKSDIGRDDYRAFIYHSVFFKARWLLPAYIIIPPIIGLVFSLIGGRIDPLTFLISTMVSYVLILGMTVFRTERSLKKMKEESPNQMKLTPTTFTFFEGAILNSKKTGEVRVPYRQLVRVCETSKRFILYFDNKKAMLIRKEDIMRDADIEAFRTFINSKAVGGK